MSTLEKTPFSTAIAELNTFRDMVRWGASQFNAAGLCFGHGIDNAWDEALCLVRYALHLSPAEDKHVADARLLSSERQHIAELFRRRIEERKPAAYLTQQAWFAGLPFYVDERVIIPRSPVAELIEQGFSPWLDDKQAPNILDLCTGSGCIAIACALMFPEASVDAVDISADALAVAKKNSLTYQGEHSVTWVQSDLFEQLPAKKYDVIICNPPYVDARDMRELPTEFTHEPRLALVGGVDGLDVVARVLAQAADYLTPEGILIVEVGNSMAAMDARFPGRAFTWLEFERGGHGVFLVKKKDLTQRRKDAEKNIKHKKN